jgi:predicted short-subunit dehydrogenase-like oxidoreductase (DUF2520 family)
MIKVTLIGRGNVSYHLDKAFNSTKEVKVLQVLGSRANELKKALQNKGIHQNLVNSDICIVAVSDNALGVVLQLLKKIKTFTVHTSGSVPMAIFPKNMKSGVFYPLQTFSKDRNLDYKTIPICLEAKNSNNLVLLKKMAHSISDTVHEIDSSQRKQLHLAAVFVNNFTNQLYQVGHELCEENKLPFDLLKPLIKETASKTDSLPPHEAQTGPAKRGDQNTIDAHLKQLKNQNHKEIYRLLTDSIQKTHGKKL